MARADVGAIVVAAGSGSRFGGTKQFEMLGELMAFQRVIRTFADVNGLSRIIIVGRPEDRQRLVDGVSELGLSIPVSVVDGGATRQESVYRGLIELKKHPEVGVTVVHDAARMLIDKSTIERVIDAIRESGSALAAVPVVDTLKRVRDGSVIETISRESLWRAQTPQGAKLELLLTAFEQAISKGETGTDEAELLEKIGEQPRIVAGDELNFKVTYPVDLERVRMTISSGRY